MRNKRYVLSAMIAIALILGGLANSSFAEGRSPHLVAYPFFSSFYLHEPATFVLKNNGPNVVVLRNSAPWRIIDAMGRTIFSPIALAVLTPINPGESRTWRWNQQDNAGRPVRPGEYAVVFDRLRLQAALPISARLGSRGFFTFGFPDEAGTTLRVFMTDPQAIRDAIENYYGLNGKSIPIGPLLDDRPGRSPYDPQWSWHFDPPALRMAELTIEVCDGTPQYVEENLDDWLATVGSYCPWNAKVKALE